MKSPCLRLLVALVGAMLLGPVPGAVASPSTPPSETAQACTDGGGVWVAVDLPEKTIAAGCAHNPSNGMDALRQIGVEPRQTPDKPGFVCAMQGLPEGACSRHEGYDKKTRSYWSYWHATAPGAPWSYSQQGAEQRKPPAGSVEGWRWGDKVQPRTTASPVAAPAEVPEPSSGTPWWVWAALAVTALGGLVVMWQRRRGNDADAEDVGADF